MALALRSCLHRLCSFRSLVVVVVVVVIVVDVVVIIVVVVASCGRCY